MATRHHARPACTTRATSRQHWRARRPRPQGIGVPRSPPIPSATHSFTIAELAHILAVGIGPVRDASSRRWRFDRRHGPAGGRLPLEFHARAVAAPPSLLHADDASLTLPADALDMPQLEACQLAPHARAVLVFIEPSGDQPVLPDVDMPAPLYWRLVSTDSCEALHSGVLLTLRTLLIEGRAQVCAETGQGEREPIVAFGMQNALRIAPFERHVMLPRAGVRVEAASGRRQKPRVLVDKPLRRATYGGALHQLVWVRVASGSEYVMDFTGPQYGIDHTLPATGTPFWMAPVPRVDGGGDGAIAHGFELSGERALFSEAQLHPGVLSNPMHAQVARSIHDSALGVIDHRRRHRE